MLKTARYFKLSLRDLWPKWTKSRIVVHFWPKIPQGMTLNPPRPIWSNLINWSNIDQKYWSKTWDRSQVFWPNWSIWSFLIKFWSKTWDSSQVFDQIWSMRSILTKLIKNLRAISSFWSNLTNMINLIKFDQFGQKIPSRKG